jgi:hypothetical protein
LNGGKKMPPTYSRRSVFPRHFPQFRLAGLDNLLT